MSKGRLCYMVTATLPDEATAAEFVAWLRAGHVDDVIRGGAESGIVVRLDAEPSAKPRVMTQYLFSSREVFDVYVREHAPRLRAEGLQRFGPERGVRFERALGDVQ